MDRPRRAHRRPNRYKSEEFTLPINKRKGVTDGHRDARNEVDDGGDDGKARNEVIDGGDDGQARNEVGDGGADREARNEVGDGWDDGKSRNEVGDGGEDGEARNEVGDGGDDREARNEVDDGGDDREARNEVDDGGDDGESGSDMNSSGDDGESGSDMNSSGESVNGKDVSSDGIDNGKEREEEEATKEEEEEEEWKTEHSDDDEDQDISIDESLSYSLTITPNEWKEIRPCDTSTGQRHLRHGYSELFADKLRSQHPSCVISFFHNRVRTCNARMATSYFRGKARCSGKMCKTVFTFIIANEPLPNSNVTVLCSSCGPISHSKKEVGKRHLTGEKRKKAALACKRVGITNYFYERFGNSEQGELDAGNYTNCQSKTVLRKAVAELVQKEILHKDLLQEVLFLKDVYNEEDEDGVVKGYLQHISASPFYMHMYSRQQIQMLIQLSKSGKLDLYFDATGSIIKKIADQKRPLLYSLVVKPDRTLPPCSMADFVTTDHSVPAINHFLSNIVRYGMILSRHQIHPRKVEVDWSWALIQSCLQTFCQQTVKSYLKLAWRIYLGELREEDLKKLTVVHICTAHMLHSLARVLRDVKNGELRRFLVQSLRALIDSTSLRQASNLFRDMCTVLAAARVTGAVQASMDRIQSQEPQEDDVDDQQTRFQKLEGDPFVEEGSIKVSSPFTAHFHQIAEEVLSRKNDLGRRGPQNRCHGEDKIKLFLDKYLPIFPLISGLLLGDITRYQSPATRDETQEETHSTNSAVEAWFRTVKLDILQSTLRLRPAGFVRKMSVALKGRLRELQLPNMKFKAQKTNTRKMKKQGVDKTGQETDSKSQKGKKRKRSSSVDSIDVTLSVDGWCRKRPRARTKIGVTKQGLTGMHGLRNTVSNCWLNSTLQLLAVLMTERILQPLPKGN
jgi:hypothetical protein